MSRGNRLALIALAVVVAVVAFVIAQPGDEESEPAQTAASPTVDTNTGPATVNEPTEQDTEEAPPPERPQEVRIRIRGGEPVGGLERITVKKGDTVRLAVSSDTADHVHVHGYDVLKDIPAGGTARLRFRADIEGVFEIELEDTHTQIASLTVEP